MTHDYINADQSTLHEMENAAYMAGDTDRAALMAALIAARETVDHLEDQIENTTTLAEWERAYGPAHEYYQFFRDCFERLGGHYPCPSVKSDYDKMVIFEAIKRGEGVAE